MASDDALHHASRTGSGEVFGAPAGQRSSVSRPRASAKDQFQQTIITIHRWLGVIACVFFVMWFISGLVLAYVRWPAMPLEERLDVLKPLAWSQVVVSPSAALQRLGLTEYPKAVRLEMSEGRPVYRVDLWNKEHRAVSAVTGAPIEGVTGQDAVNIVRDQLSAPSATLSAANLKRDQWTVTGYWNWDRPFHRVDLNDSAGTQVYVSVATGEVVLRTGRTQRILNWFGAIPHWLYFEFIRWNGVAWTWTVYVFATVGIFVALSGFWIGITRLRLRARYPNGKATPFSGWMKWHHISGLLGGVFLSLWIITGLGMMYPGGFLETRNITQLERQHFAGATTVQFPLAAGAALEEPARGARRATLRWVGGQPLIALEDGISAARLLDARTGAPVQLTPARIAQAAKGLLPGAKIVETTFLAQGDEYYHTGFKKEKLPAVRVKYDDAAKSWFHFDPETGDVLALVDNTSRIDRWTIVAIHDVDWYWLLQRRPWWDLMLFGVTLPGLLISITALTIGYRRLQRTNLVPIPVAKPRGAEPHRGTGAVNQMNVPAPARSDVVLVAYASQTGTAKAIAERTAASLEAAGLKAKLCDLGRLDLATLNGVGRALFVIATSGDGDAPDHAMNFESRVLRRPMALSGLEYGLLALGDVQYRAFCGFGLAVDRWLQASGARPLFPTIQAHDVEAEAMADWARGLAGLTGRVDDLEVARAPFEPWRLAARRLLNEGSAGEQVYHVELEPVAGGGVWQAGDIVQLTPVTWVQHLAGADQRVREFSAASVPEDGRLHLLVRQMRTESGELGLASRLLTCAPLGEELPLRLRGNMGFHPPADAEPMILIGNGTGLAGLRSHLRRRVHLDHHRNWLIFGERNAATDSFYADELQAWLGGGELERLDLVFSRDQAEKRYVQDRLRECAEDVRAWVRQGAAIYVCGSLHGMAPAVSDALSDILGAADFDALVEAGRYRRDVY